LKKTAGSECTVTQFPYTSFTDCRALAKSLTEPVSRFARIESASSASLRLPASQNLGCQDIDPM
jgi:hypothetical protein